MERAGDASGDVLIFSPLNLSAISTNTELSSGMTSQGTPGSSAPKLTTPLLQTTPLPKMGRGQGTPMSASTPASRSLRVRVSARKLREIESPYSSDQSLASLQSEAIGAIPGSPAPPSQPPGGPATPPNPNLQSNEPLESSAFPRAPAPPPLSAAAVSEEEWGHNKQGLRSKALSDYVKQDQSKGRALKQGLLLESSPWNLSGSDEGGSILVSSQPPSSMAPGPGHAEIKLKLLKERAHSVGKEGRQKVAALPLTAPHQLHLIRDHLPTAPRNFEKSAPDQASEERRSEAVASLDTPPGYVTGLPADSPPNLPAKEGSRRECSVGARQKPDTTEALGGGGGAAVGGVCSSLEDASVRKTAQLVATCTAAATAAVLKATHLQCSELKSQESPPHVRRREPPVVTWQASPPSWQSPQAYDVWRKNRQRDALDRAKARFDSHQQASLDRALQGRSKPQQDSGTGGDLGMQRDSSIGGDVKRLEWDRNKPQQDGVVGIGQKGPQQDRSKPRHVSGVVSDLKGQQDIAEYSRRLTEDVQMRDMLRRLEKLEELEHAKTLRAHHKLEPEHSFPASSSSLNLVSTPGVTKSMYTSNGGSVVGHVAVSSSPAAVRSPHSITAPGGGRTATHDEHSNAPVLPDEQVWQASQEAQQSLPGSGKQWMRQQDRILVSVATASPQKAGPSNPSSRSIQEGAKASQEGISQIENVLQKVRLSCKEAEFLCSVAEMEDEEAHMERLLKLLTNYSTPDQINVGKICATLSQYLSQLPPSPQDNVQPKHQGSDVTRAKKRDKMEKLGPKRRGKGRGSGKPNMKVPPGMVEGVWVPTAAVRFMGDSGERRHPPGDEARPASGAWVNPEQGGSRISDPVRPVAVGDASLPADMKQHTEAVPPLSREEVSSAIPLGRKEGSSAIPLGREEVSSAIPLSREEGSSAIPLGIPCVRPSPLQYPAPLPTAPDGKALCVDVGMQTSMNSGTPDNKSPDMSSGMLPGGPPDAAVRPPAETDVSTDTVCIEGKPGHTLTETPPPATPTYPQNTSTMFAKAPIVERELTLPSAELDERIQHHLETRATEWVQKELMARMLAQLEPSPPSPPRLPSAENSCSTCSSPPDTGGRGWAPLLGGDGMQVFVGAGVGVDEELVEAEVRTAVRDELCHMIKELSGQQGCISVSHSDVSEPFPSYAASDGTSSPSPLTTPVPTPPLLRSFSRPLPPPPVLPTTPPEESCSSVATPTDTPPASSPKEDTLATPQASDPEHSSSSIRTSSPTVTYPIVSTPSATPIPPDPSNSLATPLVTQESEKPSEKLSEKLSEKPPEQPPALKLLSLSASSSSGGSTSTGAPPPSLSATPSPSTTDHPISMGEYILKRHVPIPWPLANSSLSEGEVPLSPGDVRWNALCARKMKDAVGMDSTLEAFLDLKNSPDPSTSASSSQFSDSQHSESNAYSVGEVQRPGPLRHGGGKTAEDNPEDTPTTTSTTKDNTLSDLPSLRCDEAMLTSSPKKLHSVTKQQQRSRVMPSALKGRSSPGEVNRQHLGVNFGPNRSKNASFLPISDPRSEGEVPAVLSGQRIKVTAEEAYRGGVVKMTGVTPGEAHAERDVVGVMKVTAAVHEGKAQVEEDTVTVTELTSTPEEAHGKPDVVKVTEVAAAHSYTEGNVIRVTEVTTDDATTPPNRTRDGIDVISLSGSHTPLPAMSPSPQTAPQQSPSPQLEKGPPSRHSGLVSVQPSPNPDHVIQLASRAHQALQVTPTTTNLQMGGEGVPTAERRGEWSAEGRGQEAEGWRDDLRTMDTDQEMVDEDTPIPAVKDVPAQVLMVQPSPGGARQLDVRIPTMVTLETAQGSGVSPLDTTLSEEETAQGISEITPLDEIFSVEEDEEVTSQSQGVVMPQGHGDETIKDGSGQGAVMPQEGGDEEGDEQGVDSFDGSLQYTSYSLSLSGGMD